MLVTLAGMAMDVRIVQFPNTFASIVFNLDVLSNVTVANLVQ